MSIGPAFDTVLAGAQRGSEEAWAQIYRDLVGPVTGYLTSRSAADPEDLASETFLQVAKGITGFSGDESKFRSWVFVIAHRRLQDERRRSRRRVLETVFARDDALVQVGGDVEAEAMDELSAEDMIARLNELTHDQRDVVMLRVVAGMSVEQTAQVMGKRPGAVRALQHRALGSLRRILDAAP